MISRIPTNFWLVAALIGTVVPYGYFIPWVMENGFDLLLLSEQATTNPIGQFFTADLTVSAIILIIAVFGTLRISLALLVTLATCLIGVSAGLPLYFYFLAKEQDL